MFLEFYEEVIKRDFCLFFFEREGLDYTLSVFNYQFFEGRYQDIIKVYIQVEFKRQSCRQSFIEYIVFESQTDLGFSLFVIELGML